MAERIESVEIKPMKGHSRGEWYGTIDDAAHSQADAEYWALFGVTHRGNRRCLGEFPNWRAAFDASRVFLGLQRHKRIQTRKLEAGGAQ